MPGEESVTGRSERRSDGRIIERKSLVAERFNRTIKNKIYKHMVSISKNVY